MTLPDFVTGLEMELRLRGVAFERRDLDAFAADVWRWRKRTPTRGGGPARSCGSWRTGC